MKTETVDVDENLEETSNKIASYLHLFNRKKQSPAYRIENNTLFLNKAKKEKSYQFKEIFSNEELLVEYFGKILELKTNKKRLIVLFGAKKTRKKHFFIEILEQLIINFLDLLRNKNFQNNSSETNSLNYELKVNYEQYPADPSSKELNFTLNSQFYVSQMIAHHQKLTASVENSFNKFKNAFMKRNYINKNEVN